MVTIAEYIIKISDFSDALIEASDLAIKEENDFENEETIFIFEDKSKIKFCALDYSYILFN